MRRAFGRCQIKPAKSLLGSALVAMLVMSFANPLAHADVIYTYTGNDFTAVIGSPFTTSDFVTLTLDYVHALPDNTISTITPKAWTFAAGPLSLSSTADPATDLISTYMGVNAEGVVTQWALEANANSPARGIATSNQNGIAEDFAFENPPFSNNIGSNNQDPGTWTVTYTVPEPPSLTLLGAGLAGVFTWLAWERRRRHKVTAAPAL